MILLDSILMQLFDSLNSVLEFSIYNIYNSIQSRLFSVHSEFMLNDFAINLFVEFAKIAKNSIHFFQLLNNETVLVNERFHCNTSTYKHFINCNKLS